MSDPFFIFEIFARTPIGQQGCQFAIISDLKNIHKPLIARYG